MLMFFSCSGTETEKTLRHVDAVMEDYPDSALMLLKAIEPATLKGKSEEALYSLLLTQAMIKNGYVLSDDSLIHVARDYYRYHGDKYEKMRALFYSGKLAFNREDYKNAIQYALHAEKIARELNDDYWLAKIYELRGDIYSFTFHNDKTTEYTLKTVEQYRKAGKRLNELYSLCDLATSLAKENKYDRAIEIADSVWLIAATELMDTSLMEYNIRVRYNIYDKTDNYVKIKEMEDEDSLLFKQSLSHYHYLLYKSFLDIRNKNFESAKNLMDSVSEMIDDPVSKNYLYTAYEWLYSSQNDLKKSKKYTDSIFENQNKIINTVLQQSVVESENEFFQEESRQKQRENHFLSLLICVIVFFSIAWFVILFFYIRQRIRNKNLIIEDNVSNIYDMSRKLLAADAMIHSLSGDLEKSQNEFDRKLYELEIKNRKLASKNRELKNKEYLQKEETDGSLPPDTLFKEKWAFLNRLCQDLLEDNTESSNHKMLLRSLNREIKSMVSPEFMKSLANEINLNYDNIFEDLRSECAGLDNKELDIALYVVAGFKPKTICTILDMKRNTFYSKRRRLIEKIGKSDAPHKERFLSLLSK